MGLALGAILSLIAPTASLAQNVIPDGSTGTLLSVPGCPANCTVTGGLQVGNNLLHSFSQFSVNTGVTVQFQTAGIVNVLARVTGSDPSNILGTLAVVGGGNLFLINPNGIIFGPEARLNLTGSFVGTTANGLRLENGDVFNANLTAPLPTQLVSVNPSAFLFNQLNPAPVVNRSLAGGAGLQVNSGRTIALVGGDVRIEGGRMQSLGSLSRLELAGLAGPGEIGLIYREPAGSGLLLKVPEGANQADIILSQRARLNTTGGGAGFIRIFGDEVILKDASTLVARSLSNQQAQDIVIQARQVRLLNGSVALTSTSNSSVSQTAAGNIQIDATELVEVDGSSVSNSMIPDSWFASVFQHFGTSPGGFFADGLREGNSGNIVINTRELILRNGGQVATSIGPAGSGQGGTLTANITGSVQIAGGSPDGRLRSGLFAQTYGAGRAGILVLNADRLEVRGGGRVSVTTFGSGLGGIMTLNVPNILLTGTSVGSVVDESALLARTRSTGDAGALTINTDLLQVRDGAQISVTTLGAGRGGELVINAKTVELGGDSALARTGIFANVSSVPLASGPGGNLTINTAQLLVFDGASVQAASLGTGSGGQLTINTGDLIQISGDSAAEGGLVSSIYTFTELTGDAGIAVINTRRLTIENGGELFTGTVGTGNGISLSINASELVKVDGISPNFGFPSTINAETAGTGNAGTLTIKTPDLQVLNGAQVLAGSASEGNGGGLTVTTPTGQVLLSGSAPASEAAQNRQFFVQDDRLPSGLFTLSRGAGNAGNLDILANQVTLADGALVSVGATDVGQPGNLTVQSNDLQIRDRAGLTASTTSQGQGNILLNVGRLSLAGAGQIASTATETGNGGSVRISASEITLDQSSITVSATGTGNAGNLAVQAPIISLQQGSQWTATTTSGEGGNILTTSQQLALREGSRISTTAGGTGNGGNIGLNTEILLMLEASRISADAVQGRGGNVQVSTQGFFASEDSILSATSSFGISGVVTIRTPETTFQNSLVPLSTTLVSPDATIARSCLERRNAQAGAFVVTGTGGLPQSPISPSVSSRFTAAPVEPVVASDSTSGSTVSAIGPMLPQSSLALQEAQALVATTDGRLLLTSQAIETAPTAAPAHCE